MSQGFPGIPADIDTAFIWGGNNKIHFFKGHSYWKFDPERKPHVRTDRYPKSISEWDLPADIEGAMQWVNGRTYFFKGGQYWRFNDRQFTVDLASPEFPRQTAQWWFGCPTTSPLAEGNSGEVILSEAMDRHESENTYEQFSTFGFIGEEDLDVGDEDLEVDSN